MLFYKNIFHPLYYIFTINKLDIVLIEVVNILLDFYKYYIMKLDDILDLL